MRSMELKRDHSLTTRFQNCSPIVAERRRMKKWSSAAPGRCVASGKGSNGSGVKAWGGEMELNACLAVRTPARNCGANIARGWKGKRETVVSFGPLGDALQVLGSALRCFGWVGGMEASHALDTDRTCDWHRPRGRDVGAGARVRLSTHFGGKRSCVAAADRTGANGGARYLELRPATPAQDKKLECCGVGALFAPARQRRCAVHIFTHPGQSRSADASRQVGLRRRLSRLCRNRRVSGWG